MFKKIFSFMLVLFLITSNSLALSENYLCRVNKEAISTGVILNKNMKTDKNNK